ncbi:MAG: dinitrogenase iron-molybdenum cofactor biosynthesis protein [Clostridiales bacterium]|jgi:predicted Fe-Mo cluster-binding NifX family protein|nr:dinitrogenase iron-molybdenum cofactor biosynthesis protein [Clostridiales bacterium]
MKIAIPVDENNMDTRVSVSYGRAPYFLIYDIESEKASFVENRAAVSRGGAGIIAAQLIADSKVQALLTPRLGQNAADVLSVADIKVYKARPTLAKDNIKAFIDGELSQLEEVHPGFHGGR